ncbi:MAG: LuxR family transcriptional regulator [Novosphingobium sp.]|jgi:LuxR family transcriptional regulator|nr:LuxR family transcriptional regulator [Novosphingobium sp.]
MSRAFSFNADLECDKELVTSLMRVSDAVADAADRDDLFAAVAGACRALGFDWFTFSCVRPDGRAMILDSTFTTVDPGFLKDYDRFDWHVDDSMARRIVGGERILSWNSSRDSHSEIRKQSYLDFLNANALGSGIMASPVSRSGGVSMLGFISGSDRQFGHGTVVATGLLANTVHARAEMLGLDEHVSADEAIGTRQLSALQQEILNWIAEGKSNGDIATIMNLGERGVRYHVSEILRKLGVPTRVQAAAIAQRR